MKVNVAGEGLTPRLPARSTASSVSIPASKRTLAHFAAHLSLQGLAPASIATYTALVSSYHRAHGLLDPCRHNPLLNLAKRGAARYSAHPRATRKPITHNLLICHLHHLRQYSSLCPQDRRMLAAAFSLAFHGFLRVGEYTVPSLHRFNPSHHATAHDIIWHKHHLSFTIKRSKTDQLGRGTIQKSSAFYPYHTINR